MRPVHRIMVVEDELLIAEDLVECLRENGYEVNQAVASGEEALQEARKQRPDLVLMDISLKGPINGIVAAGRIHQEIGSAIVFLTGQPHSDLSEKTYSLHPAGFIAKPFSEQDLLEVLKAALSKGERDG